MCLPVPVHACVHVWRVCASVCWTGGNERNVKKPGEEPGYPEAEWSSALGHPVTVSPSPVLPESSLERTKKSTALSLTSRSLSPGLSENSLPSSPAREEVPRGMLGGAWRSILIPAVGCG